MYKVEDVTQQTIRLKEGVFQGITIPCLPASLPAPTPSLQGQHRCLGAGQGSAPRPAQLSATVASYSRQPTSSWVSAQANPPQSAHWSSSWEQLPLPCKRMVPCAVGK